ARSMLPRRRSTAGTGPARRCDPCRWIAAPCRSGARGPCRCGPLPSAASWGVTSRRVAWRGAAVFGVASRYEAARHDASRRVGVGFGVGWTVGRGVGVGVVSGVGCALGLGVGAGVCPAGTNVVRGSGPDVEPPAVRGGVLTVAGVAVGPGTPPAGDGSIVGLG